MKIIIFLIWFRTFFRRLVGMVEMVFFQKRLDQILYCELNNKHWSDVLRKDASINSYCSLNAKLSPIKKIFQCWFLCKKMPREVSKKNCAVSLPFSFLFLHNLPFFFMHASRLPLACKCLKTGGHPKYHTWGGLVSWLTALII